ncbi:FtsQ-type POTRA domain-containing protein [Rubrivirga sp. S365]|uniref:FtsQ-type POTRA domain-containing protein n=1 Tax=Rubrivirga litoralis TaxID=3075598 RepID=A0ABU3BLP2_9BACT|nr:MULTISPECIES: FtsQ-type POTRA domain-containing protein [unclassified Rubrivirga]MDT0630214.1 FtsQ-type POTRA domain-containing protein [Rubrivirga sp. F394]MDT7855725.1 FtsQ-type POTRA domain-containing protein [Rubrivirga sp. S365]
MADSKHTTRRRWLRRLGGVALVLALVAAWVWQRTLPFERVAVVGTAHAPVAEVERLVGVTPDSTALYALDPGLLAGRAERHPWVHRASVRRLPTGTLRVRVEEREPVALALGADGRPSHFLDAQGFMMPPSPSALYDVPVLRDAPPYHAVQPVADADLRSLLAALSRADDATRALVSEVAWGPSPTLWTTPTTGHGSVPVRLGRGGDPADQLRRLRAFWDQAVLPRPAHDFRLVDLRFDGQVVTREGGAADGSRVTGDEPESASRG